MMSPGFEHNLLRIQLSLATISLSFLNQNYFPYLSSLMQ